MDLKNYNGRNTKKPTLRRTRSIEDIVEPRSFQSQNENSKLDQFKLLIERKSGMPLRKKVKTTDDLRIWEELESLYKYIEQKEQDLNTSVEIGKYLLEQNKMLREQAEESKLHYEIIVEEQKNEIARLNHLFENGKVEREANASLQIKVESLTFENSTLREELITKEEQIIRLQESFNESDQQLKKQRRLLQVYEEKQKTLIANCKNLERQIEEAEKRIHVLQSRRLSKHSKSTNNIKRHVDDSPTGSPKQTEVIIPDTTKEQQEIVRLQTILKVKSQETSDMLNDKNRIEEENRKLQEEIENLQKAIERLSQDKIEYNLKAQEEPTEERYEEPENTTQGNSLQIELQERETLLFHEKEPKKKKKSKSTFNNLFSCFPFCKKKEEEEEEDDF